MHLVTYEKSELRVSKIGNNGYLLIVDRLGQIAYDIPEVVLELKHLLLRQRDVWVAHEGESLRVRHLSIVLWDSSCIALARAVILGDRLLACLLHIDSGDKRGADIATSSGILGSHG